MKTALVLMLSIIAAHSFAQITSTWKGNTPGHESEWDRATNWSNNSLPDEFTDVIILLDEASSDHYPVIKSGRVEINSLYMSPGASLIVRKGELSILDLSRCHYQKDQIIRKAKRLQTTFLIDEMTTVKIN